MKVGIIGSGGVAARRAQAVRALPSVHYGGTLAAAPAGPDVLDAFLDALDVVFIAAPTADHYRVAEAAAKRGVHIFLEWPPATSVRECAAIVRLAEEAGVEAGLSRPLRFHDAFSALPAAGRPSLILIRLEVSQGELAAWQHHLADMVDLCCLLARSSSVQRIDAEAARSGSLWPDALAFGLRFHNGAYAQVSMRRTEAGGATEGEIYVAGPGFQLASGLGAAADEPAVRGPAENAAGPPAFGREAGRTAAREEVEIRAFLQAIAEGQSVPVSVLDGLHTMRLVERLMGKLR